MNDPLTYDLHERILRLLDGEMDARELDTLDAELQNNREARALYIQLAALHNSLESLHTPSADTSQAAIIPIDRFLARQHKRMVRFSAMGAAALLIVSATTLWLKLTEKPNTIASFQTAQDTHYKLFHHAEKDASTEKILRSGSRLQLSSGILEATFSSGVRCIIEAPCDITCHSEKLISVAEGVAWFHVPSAASGFTVQTGNLEMIDLGTEFGVIAATDGSDEIHVTQGSVEVMPRHAKRESAKIILTAGEARSIDALGNLVKTAFKAARFPTTLFKPLTIRNAHFDTVGNMAEVHDENGYGMIPNWASSGAGIGLSHRKPFLKQAPHSGTHVAFIQGKGSISQTITGFDPSKPYTITYFVSERGLPGAATRTSASLDLGSTSFIQPDLIRKTDAFRRIVTGPLRVFGPSANIQINGQTVHGDATLLIDSVAISRAVPAIPDGGFEMAVLPVKTFAQAHTPDRTLVEPSPWKFTGGAGILHNGSDFNTFPAPEGSQVAVLQGHKAAMETTLEGFEPGVTYRLHLQSAGSKNEPAELIVLLDGKPLRFTQSSALHPTDPIYKPFTSDEFKATSAQSILRIQTASQGASFVDDLHLEFVAEAPAND